MIETITVAGAIGLAVLFWDHIAKPRVKAAQAKSGTSESRLETQMAWAAIGIFLVGLFVIRGLFTLIGYR